MQGQQQQEQEQGRGWEDFWIEENANLILEETDRTIETMPMVEAIRVIEKVQEQLTNRLACLKMGV